MLRSESNRHIIPALCSILLKTLDATCTEKDVLEVLNGQRSSMGYICQNCYTLLNTYHKKEQLLVDKAKVVIQLVNFEASSSTSHDMTVITPCNAGTKGQLPLLLKVLRLRE